jgi:hypothetical protein
LQGKKHIVPSFKVLASQYESVLPLPRDEEVASLEHLLEAPSADQSELPATPREQGAQRVEAIIERVCSINFHLFSLFTVQRLLLVKFVIHRTKILLLADG